jgi:hypothetical protein
MRTTEKVVAIFVIALSFWAILMMAATNFQGSHSNRILLVELGADAASLNEAVQAAGKGDRDGITHNIQMVIRNTYMDLGFIVLYWLTFVSLAYLAGKLGQRLLAVCSAACISFAVIADLLENHSILVAMHVKTFTDAVAVDISEYSQVKWLFFFLAALLLGLAGALNRHTSDLRRITGGVFIAAGLCGLLGVGRSRVSFDFAAALINVGILLISAALLLTVWKIYQSLKELNQLEHGEPIRHHA